MLPFRIWQSVSKTLSKRKGEWKLKPTVQAPQSEEGIPAKMRDP